MKIREVRMQGHRVNMRIAVPSGVLVVMLAALMGCGGGGEGLQLLLQLSSRSLPRVGGGVDIVLDVGDTTAQVQKVQAEVTGPGGFHDTVALTEQRGRRWVGEATFPPNTTDRDQVYTVVATVQLAQRTLQSDPVTVTVMTTLSPPQIQASLNPSQIDFRGGVAELSVTVESTINASIHVVTAEVSGPGLAEPQAVGLSGQGGTRVGQVSFPPNSSTIPAVYTVLVEATDAFGQTGQRQTQATVKAVPEEDRPPDPPL